MMRPRLGLLLAGAVVGALCALFALSVSAGGLDDPLFRSPVGGSVASASEVDGGDDWVRCPNSTLRVRRGHVDALCRSDNNDVGPPSRTVTIVDRVPHPRPQPMPPMRGKD